MSKTVNKHDIVYHANSIPKELTAYKYTHDWNKVTDPVALQARTKEMNKTGKTAVAIEVDESAKPADEITE